MPSEEFNNLDQYESFISKTISAWSNEKRTVLAAAMADRWLPVYEAFSDKNNWGNPAPFESAVQAVWDSVLSHQQLTKQDVNTYQERIRPDTPHVDDFDCEEALATIGIIEDALYCCHLDNNTGVAARAVAYGLAGVAPILYDDPDEVHPEVFRLRKVQNEIEKQLKLIELIANLAEIDQQQIEALRQKLTSRDLQGPLAPRPKSRSDRTNRAIFERYRNSTESDLKKLQFKDDYPLRNQAYSLVFSMWGHRYLQRKYFIEKLGDALARDALVRKNSTHDAAVQGKTGWDDMLSFSIRVSYAHPDNGYDVKSPREPHGYGPSFRQLCTEGGPARAWEWTHYRPPAWEEEDQRQPPELGKLLARELSWQATGDVDHPWATEAGEQTWRVRLNDFPDEIMYTLIIDDEVIGNFHDWPKSWQREG